MGNAASLACVASSPANIADNIRSTRTGRSCTMVRDPNAKLYNGSHGGAKCAFLIGDPARNVVDWLLGLASPIIPHILRLFMLDRYPQTTARGIFPRSKRDRQTSGLRSSSPQWATPANSRRDTSRPKVEAKLTSSTYGSKLIYFRAALTTWASVRPARRDRPIM